jgi:hypothetical protein
MTWIEKSLGERGQPRNPSREDTSRTHRHLEFQKGGASDFPPLVKRIWWMP